MKVASGYTIPALDGLRALAIILVLWCHMDVQGFVYHMLGPGILRSVAAFGFSGVFLFFILSGFLLFLPYARSLLGGTSWPSVKRFYQRRALRILPVYLVAISLLFGLKIVIGHNPTTPLAILLAPSLIFDWSASATNLMNTLSPPFWTLTIEWQFYLLLPWLALGLTKLAHKRIGRALVIRLTLGLGALIAGGLLLRMLAAVAHYNTGLDNPAATPGILGIVLAVFFGARGKQLDVFALGMAASLLYVWAVEQGHFTLSLQHRIGLGALLAALLGLCGCLWWAYAVGRVPALIGTYLPDGQIWAVLGEWTLGLCYTLLLVAVLFGWPWLRSFFSLGPLRFVGTISYSLYVWHWTLIALCLPYFLPPAAATYSRFVVVVSLVFLAFCSASYYCIERPFLKHRRKTDARAVPQITG
jgi:peptidoglycan/LPS O-acetylase OafA/YrhL